MEREQQNTQPPIGEAETADPRMGEAVRLLEQGVESVLTDEGFKRYLEVQSKFWDYSYNNCLLIFVQNPEATRVMGYGNKEGTTGWKSIGRQVKKGERAIKIFYPKFGKRPNPETGEEERQLIGFGLGNVFDVAQTEGEPLPEPPNVEEIDGSSPQAQDINRKLGRFLIGEGIRCESREYAGRSEGFYNGEKGEIVIRKKQYDTDPLSIAKTKTLAHEAAHFLADHGRESDRFQAELVAEAVAFIVMHHYGFRTDHYSFYYLASWRADREKLHAGLSEIQRVSQTMIRGIDSVRDPYNEDYWLEPTSVKGEETLVYPGPFLPPSTA